MRHALIVMAKEVIDNLRDRRTLASALIYGPLFGPLMFTFMINLMLDRAIDKVDEPLPIAVVGRELAPNMMQFLEQNNVELEPPPDNPRQAIEDGDVNVVLIIPPTFTEQFAEGVPARIELMADSSDRDGSRDSGRARTILRTYSHTLLQQRMMARGVSPLALAVLNIEDVDTATPTGRSVLVLGMMTYFVLFATLVGGMYLATDTTAGERERNSLEPLLALPVKRGALISGKIAATAVFSLVSLAITVCAFSICLQYVPLQQLGMSANFGPGVALAVFGLLVPFALLSASMLTVVASFTRSYKEAQTYLSIFLIIPTLPIAFASILGLRAEMWMMLIPSLSQHLLITEMIKGQAINMGHVAISVAATALIALVLAWVAARLYQREAIVG